MINVQNILLLHINMNIYIHRFRLKLMKSGKLITVIVAIIIIAVVAGGGYYAYHYESTGKMKISAADSPALSGVLDVNITFSGIAFR